MGIKIFGICGTPVKGETNTEVLLKAVLNSAVEAGKRYGEKVETDFVRLADLKITSGCTHCNWCLQLQTADRFCSIKDDMEKIYPKIVEADGLVFATPVYISSISWLFAAFVHRLRALAEGRYYGVRGPYGGILKDKVVVGCSVAWVRHGGVETTLINILQICGILGFIPILSPGFGYGVGGVSAAPLDKLFGVKDDRIAMASAANYGSEMVRLIRIIKAGKQALREMPAYIKI
ncbi:hypothetical protein DRO26_03135 [Candidatus Bathyarchaeota archaeon]|nr:MAG: hypothetical protein DRO26_03135 [Candidatus Bathyarchaeota archaeon]